MIDGQQQRVREVLDIAERNEAQAIVGENDEASAIEYATHHTPLARCELARTIDIGITEMGCGWMCVEQQLFGATDAVALDRKSTRLNSSHSSISYAVFCLKKKKKKKNRTKKHKSKKT